MKTVGIVAEYNPFHNGHKYQIDKIRELGATHIVTVMSANFAQRGEPCILSKFYRAKAAVKSGVDLVLELPTQYSLSSAEKFAFGAINILKKINVIDYLSFGVEANDINILDKIIDVLDSQDFREDLTEVLKLGYSFPKSRQMVLEKFLGSEIIKEVSLPNNILAMEYMKWIKKLNLNIKLLPIKRSGAGHDDKSFKDPHIASAYYLREVIKKDMSLDAWKPFVPDKAFEVYKEAFELGHLPVLESYGERAILYKLRNISVDQIKKQDVSEGLENRILKCIRNGVSLQDIYNDVKTKRYTMSRIKRIIYNLFLDLEPGDFDLDTQYIRIIGCSQKGLEIVEKIKKTKNIYIDNNIKKLLNLDEISKKNVEKEIKATDDYGLFYKEIQPQNLDFKNKFKIYNNISAK